MFTKPRSRRFVLKAGSGAALGLYLSPLACENNNVRPKFGGAEFDFLTQVDPSDSRSVADRAEGSHFLQFGAESSVPGWSYDNVQPLERSEWQLELTGLFDRPSTLTFEDIDAQVTAGEDVVLLNTLRCIFDTTAIPGLVATALWRGVPLTRLLETAGIDSTVNRFRIFSRDGFTNNLRRQDLEVPVDAPELAPLLAFEMNGSGTPHAHGGPVRLLVPGRYGFKSMKWVERIEATANDEVFGAYQDAFGFFDDGAIQLITKVTNPLAEASLPAGPVELFGYALSGLAPVEQVEVSIDDGPFMAAELETFERAASAFPAINDSLQVSLGRTYPFRGVWTLFRFTWDAEPGSHQLRFRATDADGGMQPVVDSDLTDGSTGYWSIRVQVT